MKPQCKTSYKIDEIFQKNSVYYIIALFVNYVNLKQMFNIYFFITTEIYPFTFSYTNFCIDILLLLYYFNYIII